MNERRFSHRGFMLDVCRHYMPVSDIKKLLDAAAICGMNRMHWHLTDDQGWRIEIQKYPRLTEIGSNRGPSYFGNVSETENNCGFYTQDEARALVAYARAAYRLNQAGDNGGKTVFDIAPALLCEQSGEELRAHLL